MAVEIREARFPVDLPDLLRLFREYADGLGVDLAFQDFEAELAGLPGRYLAPTGGLWLATIGTDAVGCAAMRMIEAKICEMKRLYVRPALRGQGIGRRLAEQVVNSAKKAGYEQICLDTLPSMGDAIRLYYLLGFQPIQPYCHNPIPGAMFLGLTLKRNQE